jgi:exo-beta-1,3-glucanase (GH17 family)/cellulose synthase/poly-beta-1,6-N-acetylglucosamine synthase-like glycosyltransferase
MAEAIRFAGRKHMRRSTVSILILVAVVHFAVFAFLNRPVSPPPFEGPIAGVSFSPYRHGQGPVDKVFPTEAEIRDDLKHLAPHVRSIRSYTSLDGMDQIPRLANEFGLKVTAGAWLDGDRKKNEREIKALIASVWANPNVDRVIVGNEVLLRGDLKRAQLAGYLRRVRAQLGIPVGTAEPWHVWLKHPELARDVDFIAVHLLPYWEGVAYENSIGFVLERLAEVKKRFPGKHVMIGEVGWPSNGRIRRGAVPSLATEASFLREFLNVARERNLDYFVMEAFDQPWKIPVEGGVGAYWGIWDEARQPKFAWSGPIVSVPSWPILFAVATLAPLFPLFWFLSRFARLRTRGKIFFAATVQCAVSLFVWVGYLTVSQYHSAYSATAWIVLLGALGSLFAIAITEAFELTELLWHRRLARGFHPVAPKPAERKPLVSLHLPICNEPPEMVRDTLLALAALDYPNLEVLVIDNNTADPGLWKPVADQCQILGPRFKFFHLDRVEGFKAGALNYVLGKTNPAAEIVAVIDSDYLVRSDWLANLVPYFDDPKIGIVQAPQDYRDGHESAFKAMCRWEQAGFFSIGMVHRNERNAIIQHGTMTLVRRDALEALGGWGEWCICEDAELGLRLMEAGYETAYVNHSYGQGLQPDTYTAYQKQRFRWAYGAVQILKRHWRELVGLRPSKLTSAQRYHFIAGWAPWFADALNTAVTVLALVWTAGLVALPRVFEFPLRFFLCASLAFFALKVGKTLWLYAARMRATPGQNLAAALAGLSLTHTIGKAVFSGLFTKDRPFMRTPKCEDQPALVRGLLASREESTILTLLALGALAIYFRYGGQDVEALLWIALLGVQSLPYLASLVTAMTAALPARTRQPARVREPVLQREYDSVISRVAGRQD